MNPNTNVRGPSGGKPVAVQPHDPDWAEAFEAVRREIRHALRDERVTIEHIGSTSVAGLPAKPVLDLLLEAPSLDDIERHEPALEALGFESRGEHGIPGRRYFRRPPAPPRLPVHLHAFAEGHSHARWHRTFRDHLRADADTRTDYGRLKRELAERLPHDRDAYQAAKTPFLDFVRGRLEPGSSPAGGVQEFYDDLSDDYHRIYADWWSSVERQGGVLHRIIEERLGPGPRRILDCTAGVGTQALGLGALGHDVMGTDLSERALSRARAEAEARSIPLVVEPWDVRDVGTLPQGPFDVVLSADNSLPHLVDLDDLERAVAGMWSKVATPGLMLVSVRDYDTILEARPRFQGPRILGGPGDRRVVMQFWTWHPTRPTYALHHVVHPLDDSGRHTAVRSCRYRALRRVELEAASRAAGATGMEWLEPERSGFFQPILVASKSAPPRPRRTPGGTVRPTLV